MNSVHIVLYVVFHRMQPYQCNELDTRTVQFGLQTVLAIDDEGNVSNLEHA